MPNVNGFQASIRIKEHQLMNEKRKSIIVALSAYVDSQVISQCEKCKIDYIKVTPLDIAWFKNLLHDLMSPSPSAGP